jgi:sec-independent protein translocase protein TatA
MGLVSPMHLLFLGILAVIIFGPQRLPEIGRSVGKSMREFKDSVSGVTDVQDAIQGINDVRAAASPTNLAGAFIPGVRDTQESVAAMKNLANPLAVEESTAAAEAAPSQAP